MRRKKGDWRGGGDDASPSSSAGAVVEEHDERTHVHDDTRQSALLVDATGSSPVHPATIDRLPAAGSPLNAAGRIEGVVVVVPLAAVTPARPDEGTEETRTGKVPLPGPNREIIPGKHLQFRILHQPQRFLSATRTTTTTLHPLGIDYTSIMRSSVSRTARPLARLIAPSSQLQPIARPSAPFQPFFRLPTSRILPPLFSSSIRKYSSDSPSILPPPSSPSETSTASSSSTSPSSSSTVSFPLAEKPSYELTFTCKKCTHRSTHKVSKQAYHKGTVLIQCPGCQVRHLIADHLKIFRDTSTTIEDILREKGEKITKGVKYGNGDVEFLPDEEAVPEDGKENK
ncbi:hypothetical protein H072_3614 [Dactylellina haptotyla CBS 200.50]|uniref:DNL-type domain-containing protein n=1 Tax=Dactylellina haptotyla (strain CBS 200.50) TaxID=1284197 RepID=S8C410_DACHA|nr:hypothetical protein H072_3614 [Dactylellina haptotyla CBS 200.50]